MLVTRTAAAEKYCPFKFALHDPTNQGCDNVNCMAWKRDVEIPTSHEEMGYCGLAGEPSTQDHR